MDIVKPLAVRRHPWRTALALDLLFLSLVQDSYWRNAPVISSLK